jgi:hypothetical protein
MKFIFLIVFLSYTLVFGLVTDDEMAMIDEMLREVGLTIDSVNFPKAWEHSEFIIPTMLDCLERPFEFPKLVERLKNELLERDYLRFYDTATDMVYEGMLETEFDTDKFDRFICELNKRLSRMKKANDIFDYFEFVYDTALVYHAEALARLTREQLRHIEMFIYDLTRMGDGCAEKYAHISAGVELTPESAEIEYYVELIKLINFSALTTSAKYFFAGMHLLTEHEINWLNHKKPIVRNSRKGRMIIGTKHNDIYTDDAIFVYDPAGDDTYKFNMSTSVERPFLAIIDKSGNDIYINEVTSRLFAAFFGNIYHFDGSGNDTYRGDDFAFSANVGSLLSIDGSGDDMYTTGKRTLGAATIGIALLANIGGNNFYSGTCFSQGFGGPLGLGLLASYADDGLNNDVYFAGGKYSDVLRDPTDFYSLSQGFGFGVRPYIAGGIGILFDEAGNDFYNGAVFSQGVSYWYALGILIDLAGNDFYNACWYPQGSGIHLAAGFLYDESGDDVYISKRGPGQGGAHDWAVGFLIDRGGNDIYSADGNCGFAITNSVAVFIDSDGNDKYERKRVDSYGHGGIAREMGSIGIFLDTAGTDSYANEEQGNDRSWISGIYGVGRSMNIPKSQTIEPTIAEQPIEEATDIVIDAETPIAEVFRLSALQGIVTFSREKLSEARKMLLSREAEALSYIFEHKINSGSIAELQCIIDFARLSENFAEWLPVGLKDRRGRAVSNTILFIGILGLTDYLEHFERLLSEAKFQQDILSALGRIKTDTSIDIVSRYIDSDDRYLRVTAVRSLINIGTERSLDIVKSLSDIDCFLIKSMMDIAISE